MSSAQVDICFDDVSHLVYALMIHIRKHYIMIFMFRNVAKNYARDSVYRPKIKLYTLKLLIKRIHRLKKKIMNVYFTWI